MDKSEGGHVTKELFVEIFDKEIRLFIEEIQENNPMIQTKNLSICKDEIYEEYHALRNDFKERIFGKRGADCVLDRHKIAACMCAAFLKVSIFNKQAMVDRILKTREKVEAYFYYVNEMTAFQAGCIFLSIFMSWECRDNNEKAERMIRDFPKLPPAKKSTMGCYDSIVFNLSQIKAKRIGIEHFDIYSYAMFFFMLENYYDMLAA